MKTVTILSAGSALVGQTIAYPGLVRDGKSLEARQDPNPWMARTPDGGM